MITKHRFPDERSLCAYASAFAACLQPGDVVAIGGQLGAGKTTFVRAVVNALHGADPTSSPTFTFWHRYAGNPPIDHLDLFRVEPGDDVNELGLEDAFDDARSIVLVEWWQNAPQLMPNPRYRIDIIGAGDAPRTVNIDETP